MKFIASAVILLAAIYLAADFFLFEGPVRRSFSTEQNDVAAIVADQSISHRQVERALVEKIWLQGKLLQDLKPAELTRSREAALNELIDDELLRAEVTSASPPISVSDSEVNERLRRLVGRFETKGALETAMKTQGIPSENELRRRLQESIRQEKWLAAKVHPDTQVTDEEAREWFDKNRAAVALPERIEARHIFLPTLDHPSEEAKRKLEETLATLNKGAKNFATLAYEVSEDLATKSQGGNLGWMTADRLPIDFAAPVFRMAINQPKLIRTKLGWHLVEVTNRKPAQTRSFDQAKPEILSALQAIKTRKAVEHFKDSLRQASSEKVRVFP